MSERNSIDAQQWSTWYPPNEQDGWSRPVQVLEGRDVVATVEARGSIAERNERAATIAALPEILRIISNADDTIRNAVKKAVEKQRNRSRK